MMKKQKNNYLDNIPKHNSLFPCSKNEQGNIEIARKNRGLFHWIAQRIFKKPKISYIELDEFGSFVWEQIDGERSIYEIGSLVKEHFGDKAEPLYERLAKFFYTLRSNQFILYVNLK